LLAKAVSCVIFAKLDAGLATKQEERTPRNSELQPWEPLFSLINKTFFVAREVFKPQ
jgi:hypothetical protein